MKSINLTIFDIDGKHYQFDTESFKQHIYLYKRTNGLTISDIEEKIADQVSVSVSAVHNWKCGNNGPADLETVKKIATCLDIKDYLLLMREKVEETKKEELTSAQIEALKRLYDAFVEFIYTYYVTNDYKSVWGKIRADYPEEIARHKLAEYIYHRLNKLELVVLQEYFYLKNTVVYDDLYNMFYEVLYEPGAYSDICIQEYCIYKGKRVTYLFEFDDIMARLNNIVSAVI